ncbi:hypothetical protein NNO04_15005 [Citrobacter sp. Awk 4]|nr:hypothetical protein [Citrobacter sp. Awk 4]MDA8480004.1 hypothetical protein [Citrobacter sp. Awk 4]
MDTRRAQDNAPISRHRDVLTHLVRFMALFSRHTEAGKGEGCRIRIHR